MKRVQGKFVLAFILAMTVSLSGCRQSPPSESTPKTPNQILWQIHDHIRQIAKDLKSAVDLKLITPAKYEELKPKVEAAARHYNQLKAHYELWKELNAEYQNKITVALLFVTKELQKREKKEGE